MGQMLVAGGIIQCSHKGQLKMSEGDSRLTVSGNGAITFGMESGLSFAPGSPGIVSPCPFTDPKSGSPSPCASTLPAIAGQATLLTIGGTPVLLDNATGQATNPSDPSATWSVASAGQSLLSTS
jgi:hypothetical protein